MEITSLLCLLGSVEIEELGLFEGKPTMNVWMVASREISSFREVFKEKVKEGMRNIYFPNFNLNFPIGYFDGPSQENGENVELELFLGCQLIRF